MKIVIGNLPGDVSDEQLLAWLQPVVAPVGGASLLVLTCAGNRTHATAVIDTLVSAGVAEAICQRIARQVFDGHSLSAEPVLFFG